MGKSRWVNGLYPSAFILSAPLHAQTNPDWTTPVAPFHIAERAEAPAALIYLSLTGPFRLATAWRRTNSICALTLRKSSAAHFSMSFHRSGGILSRKGLRCSEDTSGVERAGIDDGRCV